MKILLLGDYSNVHNTLAEGLRSLGHQCVVASDGDHWKDYPRDIDLKRDFGIKGNMSFLFRLAKSMNKFKGFDIVQLINPVFLELKAERIAPFYRFIRRYNKKIVLGAFGMDYYWAKVNTDIRPLRYSDFNIGDTVRTDPAAEIFRQDMIGTSKETLCKYVANDCDWIVAGLQEYWATYNEVEELKDKLNFIPFPIKLPDEAGAHIDDTVHDKLRLFIGISPGRNEYKGTDIMLAAAKAVQEKYPDRLELKIAQGVPFAQYQDMMNNSDALLDQLYSYTPAMNSLLAMSKGIINIGGGEPESYDILGEHELRPIINVQPTFASCYQEIEHLVLHPELIPALKHQSIEYIKRHHDYIKVAKQYETLYKRILGEIKNEESSFIRHIFNDHGNQ